MESLGDIIRYIIRYAKIKSLKKLIIYLMNLSWSLLKHKELMAMGSEDSVIMEVISKKYRKQKFEEWQNLINRKTIEALNAADCKFSSKVKISSLYEIFGEGIYKVSGFEPLEGQTVIDVGASIGDSAIWWSKAYGANVIAFEPLDDIFNILMENIALNGVPIKAYKVALGSGNVSAFKRQGDMMAMGGEDTIATCRLDDFDLHDVSILKIDVEGFEYEVLKGSIETIKRFKPKIILETHSKALRQKCHVFLTELGYRLLYKGKKIRSSNPGMDEVTNLFYSSDVK